MTRRFLTPAGQKRNADRRNWIADREPLCLEAGQVVLLSTGEKPEWDHIHQLALGGGNEDDNLRPMTPEAHAEKSKRDSQARKMVRHWTGANKEKPKRPWPKGRKFGWEGWKKKLSGKAVRR